MSSTATFETNLAKGRFVVFPERPDMPLLKVHQCHSDIIVSDKTCDENQKADGIVGNTNTPKAILTADCVPLVLIGPSDHVVIHAGWRGLAQNILSNPLALAIKPYYAFIGPHIRPADYEVQSDFLSNFELYPDAFSHHSGKIYFNLSLVAHQQLSQAYPGISIVDCGLCTFRETRFHSYRRDKTTQRNWNIYFPDPT